ncbi:ABC transporter ATP-binding protein [Chloroflexota bacterium]
MSGPMIKVDNISKRYRIGATEQGYKTFREAILSGIIAPVRNFGKLRNLTHFKNGEEADVIWALKDVSLEVQKGEVLGIIGRNGAGKTTILKILSRITEPTGGSVELYGRVSSLLEVGTGFHPELTGRENIFLNGAILGMRKREIEEKFDDIVGFSEIEQYIDTPVKRYSTGMQVRLAFAVAAHLEPEILLVDEVLAVGDIAFQRKCLDKMEDVARGGRTVIFVSHNMGAIRSLCSRAIWINGGRLVKDGAVDEVIREYEEQQLGYSDDSSCIITRNPLQVENQSFYCSRVLISDARGNNTNLFKYNDKISLLCEFKDDPRDSFSPEFRIYNESRQLVATGASAAFHDKYFDRKTKQVKMEIGPLPLTVGKYYISLSVMVNHDRRDTWENAVAFTITECQPFTRSWNMHLRTDGPCVINHTFSEPE